MIRTLSALLLSAAVLTGCATTQTVKVPIPVPCKTPDPQPPDFTFPKMTTEDSLFAKVKALLIDRELSKAYEIELTAALQSCR